MKPEDVYYPFDFKLADRVRLKMDCLAKRFGRSRAMYVGVWKDYHVFQFLFYNGEKELFEYYHDNTYQSYSERGVGLRAGAMLALYKKGFAIELITFPHIDSIDLIGWPEEIMSTIAHQRNDIATKHLEYVAECKEKLPKYSYADIQAEYGMLSETIRNDEEGRSLVLNAYEDLGFSEETIKKVIEEIRLNGEPSYSDESGRYCHGMVGDRIEIWTVDKKASRDGVLQYHFPHYKTRNGCSLWIQGTKIELKKTEEILYSYPVYGGVDLTFHVPESYKLKGIKIKNPMYIQLAAFKRVVSFRKKGVPLTWNVLKGEKNIDDEIGRRIIKDIYFHGCDEIQDTNGRVYPGAYLSGEIIKIEEVVNPLTKVSFLALDVKSKDCRMDVILKKSDMPDWVEPGDFVQGCFWLSGKVLYYR